MTKKEQESYKRKVDKLTDELLLGAYRSALNEVDRIHRDILWDLREKIDAWFSEHPEVSDKEGVL